MTASSSPRDYERSDAEPRLIAWIALGLAVFILGTPLVLGAVYPSVKTERSGVARPLPPTPRLEVAPHQTLAKLRAREDAALGRYGWADRAQRVARIPIDRAAALLSQRGLPGWPTQAATDAK